ncbi:MAG: DUF3048 domain-containing protein [Clostridia bacterium]|nr:DUF3048 domain-containing protein [Clostridia bacterium]
MENKGIKILVIILAILVILAGVLFAMKIVGDRSNKETVENGVISLGTDTAKKEEEKKVKIYSGTDRPIAVMIDNHKGAWPQAGLNEAYLVYEIIVEGGETRLMPVFKGANLQKIGPVRSSRHYFLDYALENDAIYVHFGWSPQAESDIKTYKVNNLNGITQSSTDFWRVKDKKSPHNAVTSTEKILEMAEKKGYRTQSNAKSVLNYQVDEVNLDEGVEANRVVIPYTNTHLVTYTYDAANKRYIRYSKNTKQTDWVTGEDIVTKNIIITFAENYTLKDVENKGRQGLKNIGDKKGYYITNGKAIEIVCSKSARTSKTVYKDLQGNEIKVNDGNTYIQICPIDAEVVIE